MPWLYLMFSILIIVVFPCREGLPDTANGSRKGCASPIRMVSAVSAKINYNESKALNHAPPTSTQFSTVSMMSSSPIKFVAIDDHIVS